MPFMVTHFSFAYYLISDHFILSVGGSSNDSIKEYIGSS
jgi:hypothetical protein